MNKDNLEIMLCIASPAELDFVENWIDQNFSTSPIIIVSHEGNDNVNDFGLHFLTLISPRMQALSNISFAFGMFRGKTLMNRP